MAGQVGLYSDVIYTLKRPDSSRPQAARSRVATREAERKPALPAGQVGLYSDVIYTLKRPDSSRPQAAKSRVATREAERKPHSGREAVWKPALPAGQLKRL